MIINLYLRKTDTACILFKEAIENYLETFKHIKDKIFIDVIDVDNAVGLHEAKFFKVVHVPSATVKIDDNFTGIIKVYSEDEIQILLNNIFNYIDCVIKLNS